jgi:succinate dehydrogenase / fumarate reductase cytochrome b subunit
LPPHIAAGLEGTEMNLLLRPVRSSLGSKYAMALTGLALIGFVIAHMTGNLLIYGGRDALNSYAAALKYRPALLWAARIALLAIFVIHILLGLRLTRQNAAARPIAYQYEATLQASWASRHMLLTGLVLLAFTVYHLAHFTLGVVAKADVETKADGSGSQSRTVEMNYLDLHEARRPGELHFHSAPDIDPGHLPRDVEVRHDVYAMVIAGFKNWWITISYLVAMAFLGLHLWHGGSSWFQSLGINHPRWNPFIRGFGPVLAVVLVAGNCSIPLAVLLGIVKP